jgi:hypothetical protein
MLRKALLSSIVLLALASAAAADTPERIARFAPLKVSLGASAAASAATPQGGVLAAGGRLALRIEAFALEASYDSGLASGVQTEFRGLFLLGMGFVWDAHPAWSIHALGTIGPYLVEMRDYIDGGFRQEADPAIGARFGVERRLAWNRPSGDTRFVPVIGLSATVLHVPRRSDPLRGMEWGGFTGLLSLTIGVQATSPGLVRSLDPTRQPAPPILPRDPPHPPEPRVPSESPLPPEPSARPEPIPRRPSVTLEAIAGAAVAQKMWFSGGARASLGFWRHGVVSATYEGGENSRDLHTIATAGAGIRTLHGAWMLEALALAGLHRVEIWDDFRYEGHDLPAGGARIGIARAPRHTGGSFLWGASASILAAPRRWSGMAGERVGGVVGLFGVFLGVGL